MSGEIEPSLHPEPVPIELAHTIGIYNQLHSISFQEFDAYQRVTGAKLKRYEIDSIQAIDATIKRVSNG